MYNKSVIQKNELKKSFKSIDKDENRRKVQEFKRKNETRNKVKNERKIKTIKKDGLISSKALKEQKKQLDKALEDEISIET